MCVCVSHSFVSDSLQSCGLYPLGSSVHGILQARILEWVAISFSRAFSRPSNQTRVSALPGGFFTTEPPGQQLHSRKKRMTQNRGEENPDLATMSPL